MADKSKIEWTDASWNPIVGCSVVSPGCTNCYAMKQAHRIQAMTHAGGKPSHYDGTTQLTKGGPVWTGNVALAPDRKFMEPVRWNKPRTIFVNSMGDLFHEDVPDEWIDRAFAIMALCPQHTFQVLTKRADRMRTYLSELRGSRSIYDACFKVSGLIHPKDHYHDARCGARALDLLRSENPLPNVWLGVSAEDQKRADERIPHLLQTPAAARFISAEPLLGPLDLQRISLGKSEATFYGHAEIKYAAFFMDALRGVNNGAIPALDWIIVGGESGPNARPMHPDWARSIRDQCQAADVPFFFKQWGVWRPVNDCEPQDPRRYSSTLNPVVLLAPDGVRHDTWQAAGNGARLMRLVGKASAGRLIDDREHNEMPEVVR